MHTQFSRLTFDLCPVSGAPVGYNMPMRRSLSTVVVSFMLLVLAATLPSFAAGLPESPANDAVKSGIARLERAAYSEALKEFDRSLDLFAGAERLDGAQRAYMQLFVSHRHHANVLMKAMKAWVEKRRTAPGGSAPELVAFDTWVKERDALAEATINLVHNSPDWK
jgi:hypothetical protein